jgi:hypothetical protein
MEESNTCQPHLVVPWGRLASERAITFVASEAVERVPTAERLSWLSMSVRLALVSESYRQHVPLPQFLHRSSEPGDRLTALLELAFRQFLGTRVGWS